MSTTMATNSHTLFTPTNSNVNSPARSSWRPISGLESISYSDSILSDILTRREYLIRHIYNSYGFKCLLPLYFTASPVNPLYSELQTISPLVDPVNISIESDRNLFYYHSSLFNLDIFTTIFSKLLNTNVPLNTDILTKYLLNYFTGITTNSNVYTDFYKNQYRAMNKGVSNMVKLHATGAIAMPIETRLHLLASSKDVIHS
jgi:hypothetical protein